MFKDPIYVMMVDEKTVKHVSEIEGESMSIYALLRAGASTMRAKRMRTPAAAIAAAVVQINMATQAEETW